MRSNSMSRKCSDWHMKKVTPDQRDTFASEAVLLWFQYAHTIRKYQNWNYQKTPKLNNSTLKETY